MFIIGEFFQIAVINPLTSSGLEILHGLKSGSMVTQGLGALESKVVTLNTDGVNGIRITSPNLNTILDKIQKLTENIPQRLETVLNQEQEEYPRFDVASGSKSNWTDSRSHHQNDPG